MNQPPSNAFTNLDSSTALVYNCLLIIVHTSFIAQESINIENINTKQIKMIINKVMQSDIIKI